MRSIYQLTDMLILNFREYVEISKNGILVRVGGVA